MKKIIIILFMGMHLSTHGQKATYFLDLGMNHSGIEDKLPTFPARNTYKNFNPNLSIGLGAEIALGKRFCLLSFIGWRISGCKYFDSIKATKYPYNVLRTETRYTCIQQINIPIMLGYNFGKKAYIKPFIGINNNYNYLVYHKNESTGKDIIGNGYYYKYMIYGMAGIIFEKRKLFNEKIGLGLKCSYEQNLRNLVNSDMIVVNQKILSVSVLLNFTLK